MREAEKIEKHIKELKEEINRLMGNHYDEARLLEASHKLDRYICEYIEIKVKG